MLLDGASSPHKMDISVGGGSMFAYTCPAPDKTTENEDCVAAIPYGPEAVVLVVADGAGGLPAGRRASQTAVRSLQESLYSAIEETMLLRTAILNGIEAANQSVLDLTNGSATTMTVVTIEGLIARTYQVGDSEALIVSQRGRVKSHTLAHSPTGFAVEAGFLDTILTISGVSNRAELQGFLDLLSSVIIIDLSPSVDECYALGPYSLFPENQRQQSIYGKLMYQAKYWSSTAASGQLLAKLQNFVERHSRIRNVDCVVAPPKALLF